jgi:uncharacterized protein (TIGR02996 family)
MSMELVFTVALEEDPLDTTTRNAYADWLEENDRPEDAERQRKWVGSYHFIKEFTDAYDYECDKNDEPISDEKRYSISGVLGEVEFWKEVVTGKNQYTQELCFSTVRAQDALSDPTTRQKFWEAFYNITGVDAPQKIKDQKVYRCAC